MKRGEQSKTNTTGTEVKKEMRVKKGTNKNRKREKSSVRYENRKAEVGFSLSTECCSALQTPTKTSWFPQKTSERGVRAFFHSVFTGKQSHKVNRGIFIIVLKWGKLCFIKCINYILSQDSFSEIASGMNVGELQYIIITNI